MCPMAKTGTSMLVECRSTKVPSGFQPGEALEGYYCILKTLRGKKTTVVSANHIFLKGLDGPPRR